jgi:pimeloyl-ACP methyl ester carboxylesterase
VNLLAGAALDTITPKLPVRLAGYGARKHAAEEVADELTLRALWLADPTAPDNPVCLLVFDVLALDRTWSRPIREAVADELGVGVERVMTSCIHTHGGPSCQPGTAALGWTVQEGYQETLIDTARRVARAAAASPRAVAVRVARGELPANAGKNRRRREWNPAFVALDFVGTDGDRVATIANFGMHPVVTGPEHCVVNVDWVGPFRDAIADALGGTAIFLQGCEGDINPAETAWEASVPDALKAAALLGESMAASVLDALRDATPVTGAGLRVWARSLSVPVGTTVLTVLNRSRKRQDVELVEWAIGDEHIVGVPGEATQGMQARIEAARGTAPLFAGFAPSWHGYFAEPFRMGYEESMSLGRHATDAIGDALSTHPDEPIAHAAVGIAENAEVREVDTTRGRIEAAFVGDSGPVLVLVHGTPGSYRQLLPLAHDLAGEFRVILPSRPGDGRTPITTGRSPAEQAAAYAALLDASGIDTATIIGVSGGGPSSAAFAAHFPQRCSGLVMVCAMAAHLFPMPPKLRVALQVPLLWETIGTLQRVATRRKVRAGVDDAELRKGLTEAELRSLAEDPLMRDRLVEFARSHADAPAPWVGFRNDAANVEAAGRSGPADYGAVRAPTLVLAGDSDTVVEMNQAEYWARALPNAHFHVVKGAGHAFLITRRLQTMPVLVNFLTNALGDAGDYD